MKKLLTIFTVSCLAVALMIFSACGKEKAAGGENLLTLIPEDASGIFVIDFKKASSLPIYDQMMEDLKKKEPKEAKGPFKSYDDFVTKTGIDPKKDLHAMAVGLFGDIGKMEGKGSPDFAMVLDVNYDKDTFLGLLKENNVPMTEENFKDLTVYGIDDGEGQKVNFSFMSDSLFAIGRGEKLQQVIDLFKGTGKSVLDNPDKKGYLKELKSDAVFSFMIDLPDEVKKVQGEGSPFSVDLTKAESVLGFVDYAADAWNGEMRLISKDEETNKQIVSVLNGLKGMGAMAGPEVGELVSNINLTAAADHIKLTFSISNELVKKLQEKAKQKSQGMAPPPPTE
jgi:hypothetical protein